MDTDIGSIVQTVVSTTNTNDDIVALNLVQAGNGSWNRVGKKIKCQSVRVTGTIALSTQAVASTSPDFCRMTLVWDKQPSSATIPIFSDIFGRTDQLGAETTQVYDPLRYDNVGRFKVLLDKKYNFNPGYERAAAGNTMVLSVDEFVNLKNRETIFSGQSNPMTIADISTGALYIIFRTGDNANNSVITVNNNFVARLRYTDI